MAAKLLGEVGQWGIPSDEKAQGIIIASVDEVAKKKTKDVLNIYGCRTGRSDYDESKEISIKGSILFGSSFTQKLGAELVLTNAIGYDCLQSTSGGRVLIDQVSKGMLVEDWRSIAVEAELLPFFAADLDD